MIARMDRGTDPNRGRRERWWRSAFIVLATIYVGLLLIGLLLRILGGFSQIALIVFGAWLLAFILSPLVSALSRRLRLARGAAIGIVYTATLVLGGFSLFWAVASIGANMAQMADEFPVTRVRIEQTLVGWQDAISFGRFEPNLVGLYRDVETTARGAVGTSLDEVPEVTVAVLGALVIVVILSLYMLADSERILAKFKRVVPNRYLEEAEIFERNVSMAFGGFLRAQVILAAMQTVLTVIVIVLLGLPYGFFIAVASALAMLIPFFGPPLALIPPIVATAIFASDWFLVAAPLLLIVQTVLVNYLKPRLMQEALGMHPLLVLIGLLVGAQVAGLWGALFGIPVFAVLNVFFNYFVNLRTIEESAVEERDEVIEGLRQQAPEAAPEELVAMAAEHVEENGELADAERAEASEGPVALGGVTAAVDDIRAAAGEQRAAAGQIGETAAELRQAVDRLAEERSTDR
jgi:predicted PurR-regulated permease PerM